ncbi:helix-turn-helix transcriptional regulator [Rhodococcus sp. RS1C4]|nr:helix-turn-helix transcriptional regulator [Rhodococcus sp. RS1C4]
MSKRKPAEVTDEPSWNGGPVIHDRRIELGLSKRQAAKDANITQNTWTFAEMGRLQDDGSRTFPMPTDDTLQRIEIALDMPEGSLLALKQQSGPPPATWEGGELVRKLREERGLTVRQAAKEAGVNHRSWSYMEQGRPNADKGMLVRAIPTEDFLGKVEDFFDLPPGQLVSLKRRVETNYRNGVTDSASGTVASLRRGKVTLPRIATVIQTDYASVDELAEDLLPYTKHLTAADRNALIGRIVAQQTEEP